MDDFSIGPQNNCFSVIGRSDSDIQYFGLLSTTTQQPWFNDRISSINSVVARSKTEK